MTIVNLLKQNVMKYEDLTLSQRIGLKGLIETKPELSVIKAVWILWNFKIAVEYFLNGDVSLLEQNKCA